MTDPKNFGMLPIWYTKNDPQKNMSDDDYARAFGMRPDMFEKLKPRIAKVRKLCNPDAIKHKDMRSADKQQYMETFLRTLKMFNKAPDNWKKLAICRMTERIAAEAEKQSGQANPKPKQTPVKRPASPNQRSVPIPKPIAPTAPTSKPATQAAQKPMCARQMPTTVLFTAAKPPQKRPTEDEQDANFPPSKSLKRLREAEELRLEIAERQRVMLAARKTIQPSTTTLRSTEAPVLTGKSQPETHINQEEQTLQQKTTVFLAKEPISLQISDFLRVYQIENATKLPGQPQPMLKTAIESSPTPTSHPVTKPVAQQEDRPKAEPEPIVIIKDEPKPLPPPSQIPPAPAQPIQRTFVLAQPDGNHMYIFFKAVSNEEGVAWPLLRKELREIVGPSFADKVLLGAFWKDQKCATMSARTQTTLESALEMLKDVVDVRVTPVLSQG